VANALGIAVAMTALWLSPFKVHPQISMIMWVSMLTAAIATIVVIPALTDQRGIRQPE
jgi:predicted RND superfamily exporter protein